MELLRYNFKILHVPGKNMYIADSLSRAPTNDKIDTSYLENGAEVVYSLVTFAKDEVLDKHKAVTGADNALQKVRYYIENGWPEHKNKCDVEAQPFWDKRYELQLFEGLFYMENRLVIPKDLRTDIL